jgi:membrane-bound ClpP family serine protease
MTGTLLQALDNFLLDYNVGHAIFFLFVLSILGSLPLKSQKVLSLNVIVFGLIFMVTPASQAPVQFTYLGIILLILGPVLYATARR